MHLQKKVMPNGNRDTEIRGEELGIFATCAKILTHVGTTATLQSGDIAQHLDAVKQSYPAFRITSSVLGESLNQFRHTKNLSVWSIS